MKAPRQLHQLLLLSCHLTVIRINLIILLLLTISPIPIFLPPIGARSISLRQLLKPHHKDLLLCLYLLWHVFEDEGFKERHSLVRVDLGFLIEPDIG